jgi:ribonuclease Z
MIDRYEVPVYELNRIKNGADYVTPEGEVVPNSVLTTPAAPPRRYAYCSDTIYNEKVIPQVEGVDLLFHEATFADSELARARETYHTTARQAATIAQQAGVKQLVIGHFSARYEDETPLIEEARTVFANTIQAKENLCIKL